MVNELILKRRSPRDFTTEKVSPEKVRLLLEAARLAASSYNEQPWRIIVATRDDPQAWDRFLGILVDRNRAWAQKSQVLMLSVAKTSFSHNGAANRHAWHDVGLAAGNLSLQATGLGLSVHQMAGYDRDKAREAFGIPDDFEPVAAIAIGYSAEAAVQPHVRKPLDEIAFGSQWGKPWRPAASETGAGGESDLGKDLGDVGVVVPVAAPSPAGAGI